MFRRAPRWCTPPSPPAQCWPAICPLIWKNFLRTQRRLRWSHSAALICSPDSLKLPPTLRRSAPPHPPKSLSRKRCWGKSPSPAICLSLSRTLRSTATASSCRLKLNPLHQRIKLAFEPGFLLAQIALGIAQRRQFGFRCRQLTRILLHLILLSADAV